MGGWLARAAILAAFVSPLGCKMQPSRSFDIGADADSKFASFCQVSGSIADLAHSTASEPHNQYVRLRFDAEDLQDCRQQTMGYCAMRMEEGAPPVSLQVIFRKNDLNDPDRRFAFARDCTLHPL